MNFDVPLPPDDLSVIDNPLLSALVARRQRAMDQVGRRRVPEYAVEDDDDEYAMLGKMKAADRAEVAESWPDDLPRNAGDGTDAPRPLHVLLDALNAHLLPRPPFPEPLDQPGAFAISKLLRDADKMTGR